MENKLLLERSSAPSGRDEWILWVLLLGLTASLAGNVILGLRMRPVTQKAHRTYMTKKEETRIGIPVPSFTVYNLTGQQETLSFTESRPTIIYIFSPSCKWCAKNLSNIRLLASQKQKDFTFVGLSVTPAGLDTYLIAHPLPFPIYVIPASNSPRSLPYEGTPQTFVIGRGGTIEHNWIGAYSGSVKTEVESYFRVRLPADVSFE